MTIKDIAELANVSTATVSRVLNNKPDVNEDTRRRILELIESEKFTPRLVKSGRDTIGVFANFSESPLRIEYVSESLNGIVDVARDAGLNVSILSVDWLQAEPAMVRAKYRNGGFVGFVLMNPHSESELPNIMAADDIPHVVLGGRSKDERVNWVIVDNYGGTRRVVEHLLSLGHRRIGIVVFESNNRDHQERLEMYKTVLREHGHEVDPGLITYLDDGLGVSPLQMLRTQDPPTAILSTSYEQIFGLISSLSEAGLRVPEDISVAGFGDYRLARYFRPLITTVRVPAYDLGRAAGTGLLKVVRSSGKTGYRQVLETEFFARESTGPRQDAQAARRAAK